MATSISDHNDFALSSLRRRWALTAVIWGSIFLLTYQYLQTIWPSAGRWALVTSLVLAYNLWGLWHGLSDNHRKGESKLFPTFGLGNTLSLARGLGLAFVAGFIGSPWPTGFLGWWPVLLYLAVQIADLFDGYLARITDQATVLGDKLDIGYDGLGVLVVTLLAVWYGQLPLWYLIIGSEKYWFLLGLWWRKRQGLPIYDMTPSVHRRIFAGYQMVALGTALCPVFPYGYVLLNNLFHAVPTTIGFLRDWFVVSGRLDPTSAIYRKTQRRIFIITTQWIPPFIRLAVAISMFMIYSAISSPLQPAEWAELLRSWQLAFSYILASLISTLSIMATIGVLLGFMGRLGSFWLVISIVLDITVNGLGWSNAIVLLGSLYLQFLGTGHFSLFVPREKHLMQRMGATRKRT